VLSEQAPVQGEKQYGAIASAAVALDGTHDDVTLVCRRGFAKSIRLRTGHVDGGVEIQPELFPAGGIARANHQAIIEALRIATNERFGKDDHFRTSRCGFLNQPHRIVHTPIAIEGHGSGLHDCRTHPLSAYFPGHRLSLSAVT
jgi:hypothetical protein